jgi:hypothetical protein
MPRRWSVLWAGALGVLCGLVYSAFVNFYLLPYAFESFDMTAYLVSGLLRNAAIGVFVFAAAAIIHNLAMRFRRRRPAK